MLMSRCYPTNCIYDFQVKTHITFFYYFTSHESVYMYIMLSCTITLKATENTLHPPWHKKRVHNFAMAFHFTQGKNDAKRKYGSERWTILSALFRLRSIFFFCFKYFEFKNRKCSNFRLVAPNEFKKMEIPAQWWHPLIISIVMYVDEFVQCALCIVRARME